MKPGRRGESHMHKLLSMNSIYIPVPVVLFLSARLIRRCKEYVEISYLDLDLIQEQYCGFMNWQLVYTIR
jgi:hypothetical protein